MGISIRAYARYRGVSDAAVRKAIAAGRITPEADGTIDTDRADVDWARNTEAPRTGTRIRPVRAAATPDGGQTPDGSTSSPTGGTSLLQARTVNEVVKAQTNKVRLARLKGELVDRSQAIAHVFKLARAERDAWLNWPARVSAQMAATLSIDPHTMHVALESAVREHLRELGELRPRVD
ncbi:elements of external origin [Ralstonia solanacearum]|uniref:Elements of external origin n=1 Tax=Ralstonia solanacearum TaxID=305 RepID=A0AAD0WGN0_RALSL|nr:elements of external origin [Ralstonia solanacearum]AXV82248.1 elements of external origin [Ralstonia solanacearum]AXW53376.1 elements of external origin [Ralstonia solanacearum]